MRGAKHLKICFHELEASLRGRVTVDTAIDLPPMIRQEIHVMLCCHEVIRTLISRAAEGNPNDRRLCGNTRWPGLPGRACLIGPPLRPQNCCASLMRRPFGAGLDRGTTATARAERTDRPGLSGARCACKPDEPFKITTSEVLRFDGVATYCRRDRIAGCIIDASDHRGSQ
jgi:hypothetical protein